MRLMKNISRRIAVCAALALAISILIAHAQRATQYPLSFITTNTAPLTNAINSASTNYFNQGSSNTMIWPVGEFDNVGFSLTYAGTAASTATGKAIFVRSFDNAAHFETVPIPANTIPMLLAGTAAQNVCSNLDLRGATHVELLNIENSAAVGITNITIAPNLKSPKYGARQATQ